MRTAPTAALVSLAIAAASVGCGPDAPDPTAPFGVTQTADAIETATIESSLFMAVARALEGQRTSPDRLADALSRATTQAAEFYDAACVRSVTREGPASLRVQLRDCGGRLGLRGVTGELVYAFEPAPDGALRVSLTLGSAALRVGAARITALDTTARLQLALGVYSVTIERSTYTAFGGRGQYLHRDVGLPAAAAPLEASWNFASNCFSLSGGWRVRVGATAARARTVRVDVNHYRRCAGGCPQVADDAVVVTDESPSDGAVSQVTLSFLGASTASWTSTAPAGSGTVALACMN